MAGVVGDRNVKIYVSANQQDNIRIALSWPEANKLQYDLRQACAEAGIMIMGAAQ
jgi:hypothetical protein